MQIEKLIEFLIKAKTETYAGKGPKVESSRPNSHDLEYREDNLVYIDTYLGGAKFSGEEAVWLYNKPIWAMNYIGRILKEGFDGNFLKDALSHVDKDLPYRGPSYYKVSNLEYKCRVNGDFNWFDGYEEIFNNGTKVYECRFHGGEIS